MQTGCPELFRRAKGMGLTTSFDPDSDPSGIWDNSIFETLKHVDVFLPNETEAIQISKKTDVESALERLSQVVNTTVVKLGKSGVWSKNSVKTLHSNVFKVEVVDTTGAGDSFNSGFIYQYLNGSDIEECTLWGSACAGISTTKSGGTTAFPDISELQQFFAEREEEIKKLVTVRK
jgi:sugar/nucleoside kinase (ribokinase family)